MRLHFLNEEWIMHIDLSSFANHEDGTDCSFRSIFPDFSERGPVSSCKLFKVLFERQHGPGYWNSAENVEPLILLVMFFDSVRIDDVLPNEEN